jgi:hypothetical protein
MCNRSFAAGVFPSHYKTGRVVPLLKKACLDKDDPANCRPITSLRTFSKVLEKLALTRIQLRQAVLVVSVGLQSETVDGNRLRKIMNDIGRAAGDMKCTVLLSLDIPAALDTIYRSILFSRLDDVFGIRGTVLDWLRSFIAGRV